MPTKKPTKKKKQQTAPVVNNDAIFIEQQPEIAHQEEFYQMPTRFGNVPVDKAPLGWDENLRFEKHPSWKGDQIGYRAIHQWMNSKYGYPKTCEVCGGIESKSFQWANISGCYKRSRSDWKELCVSCHKMFDNKKET